MGDVFQNWLSESYHEGTITDEELEIWIAEEDPKMAYELFMDCWQMDPHGTGEMARDELKRFKRRLSRLKND